MINLAVVGSPAGNRFPHSDQMKTTERITRLNDDMWLYEIKTEDPVVLTGSFTVRYPMRNDPNYEWWEYACHEGNTIVPNYTTTSRHERANPDRKKTRSRSRCPPDIANALAGKWVGRPAHQDDRVRHRARVREERRRHGAWQADRHDAPEGTADQSSHCAAS